MSERMVILLLACSELLRIVFFHSEQKLSLYLLIDLHE
jgi:hypothetical protein